MGGGRLSGHPPGALSLSVGVISWVPAGALWAGGFPGGACGKSLSCEGALQGQILPRYHQPRSRSRDQAGAV